MHQSVGQRYESESFSLIWLWSVIRSNPEKEVFSCRVGIISLIVIYFVTSSCILKWLLLSKNLLVPPVFFFIFYALISECVKSQNQQVRLQRNRILVSAGKSLIGASLQNRTNQQLKIKRTFLDKSKMKSWNKIVKKIFWRFTQVFRRPDQIHFTLMIFIVVQCNGGWKISWSQFEFIQNCNQMTPGLGFNFDSAPLRFCHSLTPVETYKTLRK